MKTLLIPVDYSPQSQTVLSFALKLAALHACKLLALNVVETPQHEEPPSADTLQEEQSLKNRALERLKPVSRQIEAAGAIKYECLIETGGDVVEVIISTAKKKEVEMIVIGSSGENNAEGFAFGTIASDVIEHAACAVWVVPSIMRSDRPIRKITYATNFLQSDLDALKSAVILAEAWDAELNIVHVYEETEAIDEPEKDVSRLGKFIKATESTTGYKRLSFELLSGENAESRLTDYVSSDRTDALLLSTRRRSYFGRLLNGSLSQNLARSAVVPLLVFHHHNDKLAFKE